MQSSVYRGLYTHPLPTLQETKRRGGIAARERTGYDFPPYPRKEPQVSKRRKTRKLETLEIVAPSRSAHRDALFDMLAKVYSGRGEATLTAW